MRLPARLAFAFLPLACTAVRAEVLDVPLSLPSGEVAYRIPFDVQHPGTLVVDASWTGTRVISFRLEDPAGTAPVVRLSGPSPQRLRVEVLPATVAEGPVQRVLLLRSRDAREAGTGKITLTLPDAPEVVRAREEAARPKPPPPPPPDPWTLQRPVPGGATPELEALFTAAEAYRAQVIAPDGARRPDACGWQDDLLRALAQWRDTAPPDAGTASLLEAIAEGVRTVEGLRTTRDPILAGPTPEPGLRQRAWASLREQRLRPLHADLDVLTERASRGLPPSMAGATWPARMVACLVSGERQIESALAERAPDAAPASGPEQHQALLAAADALRAVLAVH
ncbi:MAG TPA: hypothetical protein VFV75_02645 [Candidatus Polarisedimenticolaceae bacterium]|nr:hypothetical protein [Candidatus Polarisedimenticolaceae bacterium]